MTYDNWHEDPEARKWLKHVVDDLVPMIEDSSVTVSIVPRAETDAKFAVELGVSIMLDKPIILLAEPGVKIPAKLLAVADEIVEWRPESQDPLAAKALNAAISRIVGEDEYHG